MSSTTNLTEADFDEALAMAEGLVMVDFWAEWCGPCRVIAPVLDEIAGAAPGRVTLMKVNVDESPALATRHGIRSIPTILLIKDGRIVDRVVGAVPKSALQTRVDAHAGRFAQV